MLCTTFVHYAHMSAWSVISLFVAMHTQVGTRLTFPLS